MQNESNLDTKKEKNSKFDVKSIIEPVKPDWPIMAHNLYLKENAPKGTQNLEVFRLVKDKWDQLSDEQKKPYQDIQRADKLRYEKEKAEFKKTGYFTDVNGVSSVELAVRKRSFKPHITLPTRVRRAIEFFISKQFAKKSAEMPGKKHFEVFAALKEDWNMISEEEKLIY